MTKEIELLKILENKDIYNKYSNLIKEHTVTKETKQIISDIKAFFKDNPTVTDIDWSKFSTWFCVIKHPTYKPEKIELYRSILATVAIVPVDPDFKDAILKKFIERDYAAKISEISLKVYEGDDSVSLSEVTTVINSYNTETGKIDDLDRSLITEDISELASHVLTGPGYDWRMDCLNKSLGPLRKGDFIVVGARPDTGKTTFLAAEATHIAPQLKEDEHVIWFNNEEDGRKVRWRGIQSALGWTREDMLLDLVRTREEYIKLMGNLNKILIVDKAALYIQDINDILKKYKAGLIIFDQLRKVHGFESEAGNEAIRLQMLFQQGREWAKEFAPVINVHQARGDAEGAKWIEMNQFDNSQTGIQGEADAIITIGRSHEPGYEKSRFIYVPKNKLSGGPKSDESFRNGKFEVLIRPEIARYEEP